jgi:PPOX class probable F420-dependent enzyme
MSALAQFAGQKYLNIETYRKNGDPVRTPVWFVESNGTLYVRTAESTGKYRRIRNNPAVRVAPCDMRGNVKGEWAKAEARIVGGEEEQMTYKMLDKKYGIMYKMIGAFRGKKDYVALAIRLS